MEYRHQFEPTEALIVLTGLTATHADRAYVLAYYRKQTQYHVFVPELYQYFGIRFAAQRLCAYLQQNRIGNFKRCHFICYISGGFVLRRALADCQPANLGRVVYLRSPIQERVPERSISRYGRLLALLRKGKMLFDLASIREDELPEIDTETGYIVEQGISGLARELGFKTTDYDHYRNGSNFKVAKDKPILITPLSHDEVYRNDTLLQQMVHFVDTGSFANSQPL